MKEGGLEGRRLVLATVFVGLLVLLAGCGGIMDSGPSVSDPRTEMSDNGPALLFNYSVSDYSTALLQGPSGQVVSKSNLEPNKSVSGFYMGDSKPGTYKIIIQSGGETVAEKSVTFDGANPTVQNVSAKWSGNSLQSVSVTMQNSGDLPVRVTNATVSVRGTSFDATVYTWIPANSTKTVTVSPSYQELAVEEPGEVQGSVTLRTTNGTFSGEFSRLFEGANLTIVEKNAVWDGSSLKRVTVTVKNTGDLPTTANATVYRGDRALASSWEKQVTPGGYARFDLSGLAYIYKASSGGNISLDLVVNSSAGFTTAKITNQVEPAKLSLQSISPNWQSGSLNTVEYTVRNSGEVATEFTSTVTVGGEEFTSLTYKIKGSSTKTITFGDSMLTGYDALYTVQSGGEVPVTVKISGAGDTVSKTSSKTFADIEGSIGGVDATFYSQYNTNKLELSSLSFTVQNTGEIPLTYDSIEISIDGTTRTESFYSSKTLKSGARTTEFVTFTQGISVPSGEHQMTIRLLNDGEVVVSGTAMVSTSS